MRRALQGSERRAHLGVGDLIGLEAVTVASATARWISRVGSALSTVYSATKALLSM
jgi:hypothetical protein